MQLSAIDNVAQIQDFAKRNRLDAQAAVKLGEVRCAIGSTSKIIQPAKVMGRRDDVDGDLAKLSKSGFSAFVLVNNDEGWQSCDSFSMIEKRHIAITRGICLWGIWKDQISHPLWWWWCWEVCARANPSRTIQLFRLSALMTLTQLCCLSGSWVSTCHWQ